jgi:alpha-beta hydrolase superfamily lysophospholipase
MVADASGLRISVSSSPGSHPLSGSGRETPLYFGASGRSRFGWLHPAQGERRADFGVVICNPFGYEATCAHRSVRVIASDLAQCGVPVLRFDYAGSGDSEDLAADSDQIAAWREDIVAAAGELRRLSQVSRIRLLGIRLGFLLAALAAAECPAVVGLIGVMPVIEGRRYLRELHRMRLAAARPDGAPAMAVEGEIEVGGFALSAPTVRTLAAVNLASLAKGCVRDLLLIDRDDLPAATAWKSLWPEERIQARYVTRPGFVKMLMTPPYYAETSAEIRTELRGWVSTLAGAEPAPEIQTDGEGLVPIEASAAISDAPAIERAVTLSSDPALFGIVTEPQSGESWRRAVILLNDGATYHVGPSRLNVILARRWARRGYHVLRMDLAGLGDSATRQGEPADEVFPRHALDDLRAAIEYMRSNYGIRDLTLGGLCSGAYHSLRAAASGLAVNRVLLINPENFLSKEGETLGDLRLTEVLHNSVLYRARIFSAQYWKRVFAGQVDLWRVFRIYLHRVALAAESVLRDMARRLRVRLPRDLGGELEEIAARGIRLVFVFAEGEAGIRLLRIQAGNSLRRLGERCRLHIIDGADHVFSRADSRSKLEATLSEELFAPAERSVSTPSRPGRP